jgi:hypothetical protein
MSCVAVAIGGAAVIGGTVAYIDSKNQSAAAQNAANTQAAAAGNAANIQANTAQSAMGLQAQEYNQQVQAEQPYTQAGYSALSQLQNPQFTQQPTQSQIMQYADPSMQFQMQQGEAALQASAAARGQTFSGNTLEAISNYGQNTAQTGYQNAFNNYYTAQDTVYNRLAGVAGMGAQALGQTNQAGQNFSNNATATMTGSANAQAQGLMGAANAQAAGTIGSANAQASGLSGLGNSVQGGANNWLQYSTLNSLMGARSNNGGMGSALFGTANTPDASSFAQPNFGGQVNQPSSFTLQE